MWQADELEEERHQLQLDRSTLQQLQLQAVGDAQMADAGHAEGIAQIERGMDVVRDQRQGVEDAMHELDAERLQLKQLQQQAADDAEKARDERAKRADLLVDAVQASNAPKNKAATAGREAVVRPQSKAPQDLAHQVALLVGSEADKVAKLRARISAERGKQPKYPGS